MEGIKPEELNQEDGIWRYMDVSQFLTVICPGKNAGSGCNLRQKGSGHIDFPRLHELDDLWEGARLQSDTFIRRLLSQVCAEDAVRVCENGMANRSLAAGTRTRESR